MNLRALIRVIQKLQSSMYFTVQEVTSLLKEKTRHSGSEDRLSRVIDSNILVVKKNETKRLLVKKHKMKKTD